MFYKSDTFFCEGYWLPAAYKKHLMGQLHQTGVLDLFCSLKLYSSNSVVKAYYRHILL